MLRKKHVDLLLIGEGRKRRDVLIKDFNTFMYNHTLIVASYCLQVFSTEEILKSHNKDTLKINDKQRVTMPGKGKFIKFKNYESNHS